MQPAETVSLSPTEPPSRGTNVLLVRLREATQGCHQDIEQNPKLKRLFDPDLCSSDYRDLLVRLLGFYEPVEAALGNLPSQVPDAEQPVITLAIEERWKTPWLHQDLRVLGLSGETIKDLPRASAEACPRIESLPEAVGCLYVLEGATLGGTLISRHIKSTLGITPESGGRFYHGYGSNNGHMWGRFRQLLANLDMDASQTSKVVTSAVQTFTRLDRWLVKEE